MKLLIIVVVSTLISHQEAAVLGVHANSPHNVISLAARKDSQESETNMTFEQALRALPPVPSVLKALLVMQLGQNISTLIRIDDNDTDGTRSLRGSGKKVSLVRVKQDPHHIHALEGSAGAAEMLRTLLTETLEKLDAENARCRSFKIQQKREIAEVSLAVSQFTADANKAHGGVLLANGRLSYTGVQLPKTREALQRHISMCEKSQGLLNTELHTHMREQSQMELIVSLAECNESTTLIQCPSKRRGKHTASLFSFGAVATRQAVAQLKLAATQQAVQEVLKDAYGTAIDSTEDAVQMPNSNASCWSTFRCPYDWRSTDDAKVCRSVNGSFECDLGYCGGEPSPNMMSCNTGPHLGPRGDGGGVRKCWNSWPCPFLMVRIGDGSVCAPDGGQGEPCGLGECAGENDPNNGTVRPCPRGDTWTTTLPPDFKEKCNLRNNPDCSNLADKLMFMLSDVSDRVSALQREVLRMETDCKKTEDNMNQQISNLVKIETDATADLALATKTLNENNVAASEKQVEFDRLTLEMTHQMSTCELNKHNLRMEECSIKKIREQLYILISMKGEVRDCQMSAWEVDRQCSATCGAGTMVQRRTIQMSPLNGAPCPPKVEEIDCDIPIGCPMPCKLGSWSGWTECSSGCGGGVEQRSRVIEQHPYNGGAACDITSESRTCNLQACNVPCVLKPWTSWSKCSKQCGKGHRTRVRSIEHEAVGEGHCPSVHDPERLWKMDCNTQACTPGEFAPYLRCTSKIDLVLMLDGSGSLREAGFTHVKHAAEKLIDAMEMGAESVVLSVLLFSGPHTWEKMYECMDGSITDLSKCGIKWVTGDSSLPEWTIDKWHAIQRVNALEWPEGGTLTSLALGEAANKLAQGRKDAASAVVVITDGKPSYPSKSIEAARSLRNTARLMWVPVGLSVKFEDFKDLASHPVEENIIPNSEHPALKNLDELELPSFQNMVIENLCPELE